MYDVEVTLQPFTFYMYISHNFTENVFKTYTHTYFRSSIHWSMSYYPFKKNDSQETLFYLNA